MQHRRKYKITEKGVGGSPRDGFTVAVSISVPALAVGCRTISGLVVSGADSGCQNIGRGNTLVYKQPEFFARRHRTLAGGDIREDDRPVGHVADEAGGCVDGGIGTSSLLRLWRFRGRRGSRACTRRRLRQSRTWHQKTRADEQRRTDSTAGDKAYNCTS